MTILQRIILKKREILVYNTAVAKGEKASALAEDLRPLVDL